MVKESNGRAPELEPIYQIERQRVCRDASRRSCRSSGSCTAATVHAGKGWPAESAPVPAHGAEWRSLIPCKYAIPFQVTDGSEWVPVLGACIQDYRANSTLMAICPTYGKVRLIPSHVRAKLCCVQIMHGGSAIRLSRCCRQGRPELWNTSENPRRSTEGSVISSASAVSTLFS